MHKLTAEMIDDARARLGRAPDTEHEHDDRVRVAYEWLDAQKTVLKPRNRQLPLKHMIEAWAACYISRSDVELAAELHPGIRGLYPSYNISAHLVEPSLERLIEIGEANTQPGHRDLHKPEDYMTRE